MCILKEFIYRHFQSLSKPLNDSLKFDPKPSARHSSLSPSQSFGATALISASRLRRCPSSDPSSVLMIPQRLKEHATVSSRTATHTSATNSRMPRCDDFHKLPSGGGVVRHGGAQVYIRGAKQGLPLLGIEWKCEIAENRRGHLHMCGHTLSIIRYDHEQCCRVALWIILPIWRFFQSAPKSQHRLAEIWISSAGDQTCNPEHSRLTQHQLSYQGWLNSSGWQNPPPPPPTLCLIRPSVTG